MANAVIFLGLLIFFGAVLGRAVCGFLCPFGFLQDLIYKIPFIKTYLRTFVHNPLQCIEAELYATNGFWSLYKPDTNLIYDSLYVEHYANWLERNEVTIKQVLPSGVQEMIDHTMNRLIDFMPWCGVCFWISIFLIVIHAGLGNKAALISYTLILCGWVIIMISTPVAYQYRYTLYVDLIDPLLLALLFIQRKEKQPLD